MFFRETQVTATSVVAGVAWAVGGVVIVLGLVLNRTGVPAIGLWLSGWGGVITMARCYEIHAAEKEKAAFDLGRQVGAEERSGVTRI